MAFILKSKHVGNFINSINWEKLTQFALYMKLWYNSCCVQSGGDSRRTSNDWTGWKTGCTTRVFYTIGLWGR